MMSDEGFPSDDDHYEDYTITAVEPADSGWPIGLSNGWSFWVPGDSPIAPVVGMAARLYGKGIGYTVRGLFLDGRRVFYRTEEEESVKFLEECEERERERRYDFEKNRADYDRRYRVLPEMFRARLDRFRTNNPDFRWDFEPYEMFVIEQAVVIAEAFRLDDATAADPPARLENFKAMPWEVQQAMVPGLSDGHSGNTFGCAVALAYAYLTRPEVVPQIHGAMAPVVGSVAYGDVPREDAS